MLEIATDTEAFGVDIERGLGGTGVLIAEGDLGVHPIADSLDA